MMTMFVTLLRIISSGSRAGTGSEQYAVLPGESWLHCAEFPLNCTPVHLRPLPDLQWISASN
jgi:hypothetical protein